MSEHHCDIARRRWGKLPAYAYPKETIERVKLLRKFHSVEDVAAIVKVSAAYVRSIEARGYQIKKAGRPLPERPGDFAIQCNHMSITELRDHYGVHQGTIAKWLVGIDRQYQTKRVYSRLPTPPRAEIAAAMRGRTLPEAARLLGVSKTTLRRWRQERGLPIAAWKGPRR